MEGDVGAAAAEVEAAMFRQNGGANQRYKAKYRSLIFNLKDANNPDLRRRVLSGEITGALRCHLQMILPCWDTHHQTVPNPALDVWMPSICGLL